ncbi:MAG: hypothetical protein Q7S11_02505 [bacterium]|nr:hypothetical protein [bacterium]
MSVKYETLPFLFLLTLLGLIGSVAIIAWSHQARRVINELLFLAEARGKQERSTLAHDIRNILAIIQADVEIALMGETSGEELRKTLKQIMTETDEINSKLNEV